ncbi:TIGR03621 family F420-dependent LLM class oxidoreductase [Williamsia sterculiae]|uniref:Probable F420-dependent oxidoreductase, MSMEG_2516 family n=1 Tax=Williamsia sterculiae TaxID=1344003 RepID=A0A1N7D367_9NOCA|nr:TIGR03621 family F420-dependent LLM class oxidoreductase [Williamsia sterculiae]SIR70230.1 probable F420-dependent oxidoreductase, MSMEG_2516 family [Williamsia sterculiae]
MTPPLRFGVNLMGTGTGAEFLDRVRASADAGVDVIMVPDHLGLIGPAPALVAAAAAAPHARVGTFVLNTAFYRPALLARDLASVDQLTGGRLEIGLGAGYVRDEFDAAGIPFQRAGARVEHLEETARFLRDAARGDDHVPAFVQSPPPIMIAGVGDRVLRLAARTADIVALSQLPDEATAIERVSFIRAAAGERADALELNVIILDLAVDRAPVLPSLPGTDYDSSESAARRSMNTLSGSVTEVAAEITRLRDEVGLSYFTFIEPDETQMARIAEIITTVR